MSEDNEEDWRKEIFEERREKLAEEEADYF
jgi:hypothetical protein